MFPYRDLKTGGFFLSLALTCVALKCNSDKLFSVLCPSLNMSMSCGIACTGTHRQLQWLQELADQNLTVKNSQEYSYTWNIVLGNGPNNSQRSKDINKPSLPVLKLEDLLVS